MIAQREIVITFKTSRRFINLSKNGGLLLLLLFLFLLLLPPACYYNADDHHFSITRAPS